MLAVLTGCTDVVNTPVTPVSFTPVPAHTETATLTPPATATATPAPPTLAPPTATSLSPTATATFATQPLPGVQTTFGGREIVRGRADRPLVALTFDCGSVAGPSARILDTLKQHDLRVTIFMTGQYAAEYPELVRRMATDGHELANHSYTHPDFTKITDDAVLDELARTDALVQRISGKSTKPWMRMPFGARNSHTIDVVTQAGYTSVFWTLDSGDWRADASAEGVRAKVLNNTGKGFIVVEHCASNQSAEALPDLIEGLQAQGLKIVTVSALLLGG